MNKNHQLEDVQYLQKKLENIHFDLYRNVKKDLLTNSFKKSSLANPAFFKIAIQESLALIRDAHTSVPDFRLEEYFPVRYLEIDGDYYIIGGVDENNPIIGTKIFEINNYPLKQILSKIVNLSSKENSEVIARDLAWFLESNKILRYYGFSTKDTVLLTTDKGDIELKVDDEKADNVYKKNPFKWNNYKYVGNDLYRYRILNNVLLFQYNDCTNEGYTKKYLQEFKEELLLQTKLVKNIIVDLRQNDGGTTEIMWDLFERFPKNKKIYVAIGRRTFSSAMHHLLYLKKEKGAILIGQNAGQKPNRFGDSKIIVLPNSKNKVKSSFKYFELLPGKDLDVIEPDITISVTIENYVNESDPLNYWIKENLK